ncbi:mechanosensitive ion channel family protein [Demequina muriae]|uniref:Mechanosensitive ion channel family protein n=1 Tax=Demequina muriae TaxID=3051664 RepID=A0ABT8GFT7_9MICO|nr:mechanosensitive ion channel family protein [Demequina sp. EGI L300058]MDN4479806.1 mechanosensitive ion channel family protein [Demequina sp. EGI L300058]
MLHLTTDPDTTTAPGDDLPTGEELGEWLSDVSQNLIGFGIMLVVVLVLWFVGRAAINGFTRAMERGAPLTDARARRALSKARIKLPDPDTIEERLEAERRRQRAGTLRRVLKSALAVVLILLVLMTGLAVVGVPVGPMLASAGILGVALGFGAQSLVKDILSGTFMLMEDQYGVGDVVDLGEATGAVEEVGLRCTRLRSLDGTVWYVPNGEIRRVGNMTRMWSRAMIEVRFAYDTDVEAARQAMIDAVLAAKREREEVAAALLGEPEVAGIESLEYNAIMLRLMCQVNPATQWDVQREVHRQMRRLFAERGISLAVPGEAMMFDSKANPDKVLLHDSARPGSDTAPKGEDGRPLPPSNDED